MIVTCVLLLIGLLWIQYSLRNDPEVKGDEKWMAVHFVLLVLALATTIYGYIFKNYTANIVSAISSCVVNVVMAYILDQANTNHVKDESDKLNITLVND